MSATSKNAQSQVVEVRGSFLERESEKQQSEHSLSWDEYFWLIAQAVLRKSKDKDRRVGAVVVGEGNIILTTGFNGFPRGIRETTSRLTKDEKLLWMTHAETNAIFNAARKGVSLVGCTLYVTTYPCAGCAQAIAQSGIRRVFTNGEYWIKKDNSNRYDIAPAIFDEAGVLVHAPRIRQIEVPFWVARDRARRTEEADAETSEVRAAGRRRRDAPMKPLAKASRVARARKPTT